MSTLLGVILLLGSVAAVGWSARSATRHPTIAAPMASPVALSTPAPSPDPRLANLTLSAHAAFLMSADSGDVLYEKDADAPRAPGSTAKIVTALAVLRHARPEEVVVIQPGDVVDASQSSMGLRAGDTVTVHDLLVGMLLPSGNDAARVLARVIGERLPGSDAPADRFVAEMNAVAADLGMTSSHFTDPAGDDDAGQVVTARDLALAARRLLDEPALLAIVSMAHAEVRVGGSSPRVLALTNTNELLSTEGVFGVKTGTTPQAGQCLVVAYRAQSGTEIAVVLGSDDRYADARALLGLPSAPPSTATSAP